MHTAGIAGIADGIDCLRQLLERYWANVHPLLDADDDNDPTMRLNVLKELCDRDGMLVPARNAPIVSFPALGTFGLRHVGLATGEIKLTAGSTESPPALDLIEGAFRNCKVEELQATAAHVQQGIANVKAIENFVTQQVGLNNALRLAELLDLLQQIERVLAPAARCPRRGRHGQRRRSRGRRAGGRRGPRPASRSARSAAATTCCGCSTRSASTMSAMSPAARFRSCFGAVSGSCRCSSSTSSAIWCQADSLSSRRYVVQRRRMMRKKETTGRATFPARRQA